MNRSTLLFLSLTTALVASWYSKSEAATAPRQLYGKSVLVTYTNTSVLRKAGTQDPFKTRNTPRSLLIYVSGAGRPFLRYGKGMKGGVEQVGEEGENPTGGATSLDFRGSRLVVGFGFTGGATIVEIGFSPGFDGCSATVVHGKSGGGSYVFRNKAGKAFEIQSSTAGGITCAVKDDNVFAR